MASTVDFDRIEEIHEPEETLNSKLQQLAQWITNANYVVFFTGAGVSTSSGVPDFRGPKGVWTMKAQGLTPDIKIHRVNAQPTPSHMGQVTLMKHSLAHHVVTSNLDGLYLKAGLEAHKDVTHLHGCIYIERCTACSAEFIRNWHVRRDNIDAHNHIVGTCQKCGSKPPRDQGNNYKSVGSTDVNCGTKDTHINFEESLDPIDWDEAQLHCSKADLVIVAGTSMSLRHVTHFPFLAQKNSFGKNKYNFLNTERGKVVIINLQKTPDDNKCDLRIFAPTDTVFERLVSTLKLEMEHPPVFRPRDSLPLDQLPKYVSDFFYEAAVTQEKVAQQREQEWKERAQAKEITSGTINTTPAIVTTTTTTTATATTTTTITTEHQT